MKMVKIRSFCLWKYTHDHPGYHKIWDMAFFRVKVTTAWIFYRISSAIEESS